MELEKLKKLNYPLYETAYYGFPEKELYVLMFNTLPSEFNSNLLYNEKVIDFIKTNGYTELSRNTNMNRDNIEFTKTDEFLFINEKEKEIIIIRLNSKGKDKNNLYSISFLYDIATGQYIHKKLFSELKKFEKTKKRYNISLIKSDRGNLDTEGFDIEIPTINIEMNYGKEFLKVHKTIVKRLNTDRDKGIVLLHGKSGTGKTNYIRYLTKCIKDKEILFIPPSMTEVLTDPSIIPFLMERKNSILVIEDGEKIISDRNSNGSSVGVSNILNLTDGIMGDCLSIQVIVTFNMERNQIDKAMVRKGRLIAEHKFDSLSIEETNILLSTLGKNYISDKGLTLAEIYNIDQEEFTTNKQNEIGFK